VTRSSKKMREDSFEEIWMAIISNVHNFSDDCHLVIILLLIMRGHIYIYLYLFVRSLTPLCFMFVHCGWVSFTNCSPSGPDTTLSIGIMCKLFLDVITFSVSFITEGQIG
jgi:hypothetical protein